MALDGVAPQAEVKLGRCQVLVGTRVGVTPEILASGPFVAYTDPIPYFR